MAKRVQRTTYASVRQMERIDMLLAKEPEYISMITGAKSKTGKPKEVLSKAEKKHRILQNTRVKYAYSKDSKTIHDKDCPCVGAIKFDNLKVSKDYITTREQCPKCALMAYVRAGGDFTHINDYLKFFEKAQFNDKQVRTIFIDLKAKTNISSDVMTLRIDSINWKLKILEAGVYGLEISNDESFIKRWINVKEALYFLKNNDWKAKRAMMSCSSIKNRIRRWCNQGKRELCYVLRSIKKLKGGFSKKTVYYVDGDNDAEIRVAGIEKLQKKDIVKIFSSWDHGYFNNEYRQKKLISECECKIEFVNVMPGSNAVDFAIGLDAYSTYMKRPRWRIVFLSADKHFSIIKRQIDILSHGMANIYHLQMICQADRKGK